MSNSEMIAKVKEKLNIADSTKDLIIYDVIQEVLNYCNLTELPEALEPFVRKKVQTIILYEKEVGTETVFDVKSIHEGDTTTTYNTDEVSRETIYGLSERDKVFLRQFRRLRK